MEGSMEDWYASWEELSGRAVVGPSTREDAVLDAGLFAGSGYGTSGTGLIVQSSSFPGSEDPIWDSEEAIPVDDFEGALTPR
jgi:hypothetical protein